VARRRGQKLASIRACRERDNDLPRAIQPFDNAFGSRLERSHAYRFVVNGETGVRRTKTGEFPTPRRLGFLSRRKTRVSMDTSREIRRRGGPVSAEVGPVEETRKQSLPSWDTPGKLVRSMARWRIGVISRRFLVSRVSYCVFGFLVLLRRISSSGSLVHLAQAPLVPGSSSLRSGHMFEAIPRASSRAESDARGFLPRTGHEIRMKSRDSAPIDPPEGHAFSQSAFIKC